MDKNTNSKDSLTAEAKQYKQNIETNAGASHLLRTKPTKTSQFWKDFDLFIKEDPIPDTNTNTNTDTDTNPRKDAVKDHRSSH